MLGPGIVFVIIAAIFVLILSVNSHFNSKKFVQETEPYFRFLMEDDYKFLLNLKYGSDVDLEKMYGIRVRNGIVTIVACLFLFMSRLSFAYVLLAFILGFLVFKMPYNSLKSYYKANLNRINLMLPYYLKGLEILIQHYTVPVALSKSIETAPEIFKPGLKTLITKIESGDSSVQPYMDFAQEYPVRDSMRMMRLLYRLGLGSNQDKHEQIMMFSKTVSSLQNKAREQKYKERLEAMEKRTMIMLFVTGGGVLLVLFMSMTVMMGI